MHQERAAALRGFLGMETSDQYREYAAECLAAAAKTDEHRKMLREIARAWERVAKDVEQAEI
jgi:hypothetical protein